MYWRRSCKIIEAVNKYRLFYITYRLRARSSQSPNDISGGCRTNIQQFNREDLCGLGGDLVFRRESWLFTWFVVFGVVGSNVQISLFDKKYTLERAYWTIALDYIHITFVLIIFFYIMLMFLFLMWVVRQLTCMSFAIK